MFVFVCGTHITVQRTKLQIFLIEDFLIIFYLVNIRISKRIQVLEYTKLIVS